MKNIKKYLIAFVVVTGALAYLIISSVGNSKIYYLEVHEIISNPEKSVVKGARVSGTVAKGNFELNKIDQLAKFVITDETGAKIAVEYNGLVPDALEEGASVIIEGKYIPDANLFQAKKLLAKCPSKYEAEEGDKHPDEVQKS